MTDGLRPPLIARLARPHFAMIHRTTSLRLHALALNRLQDPNWTGMDLYDHFKQCVRGRRAPRGLMRKPLLKGVLYQIASDVFAIYLRQRDYLKSLEGEDMLWHLDDVASFLVHHAESNRDSSALDAILAEINRINALYEEDESVYFDTLDSERWRSAAVRLRQQALREHRSVVQKVRPAYLEVLAARLFHDRELCNFIAEMLVLIGFDGMRNDEQPSRWVERTEIPRWARRALSARERGKCALCPRAMALELEGTPHIDHIVPLATGGCNDLVNLQLLCDRCNLKKSARKKATRSSVPRYFAQRRRKNTSKES